MRQFICVLGVLLIACSSDSSDAPAASGTGGSTAGAGGSAGSHSGSGAGGSGGSGAVGGSMGGSSANAGTSGTGGTAGSGGLAAAGGTGGNSGTGGIGGTGGTGGVAGSGAIAGSGGSGTGAAGASSGCESKVPLGIPGRGPDMVGVTTPDGQCLWIDQTEVTNAQYNAFLADNPEPSSLAECSWNTTYSPDPDCIATDGFVYQAGDNYPSTCIDWCDATAFCAWANKVLCPASGNPDLEKDAWYLACATENYTVFPYGDDYDAFACHGLDDQGTDPLSALEVGTKPQCTSAANVFDLSGNVAEWSDYCLSAAPTGDCVLRGGSAISTIVQLECEAQLGVGRDAANPWFGFRCCSDSQ